MDIYIYTMNCPEEEMLAEVAKTAFRLAKTKTRLCELLEANVDNTELFVCIRSSVVDHLHKKYPRGADRVMVESMSMIDVSGENNAREFRRRATMNIDERAWNNRALFQECIDIIERIIALRAAEPDVEPPTRAEPAARDDYNTPPKSTWDDIDRLVAHQQLHALLTKIEFLKTSTNFYRAINDAVRKKLLNSECGIDLEGERAQITKISEFLYKMDGWGSSEERNLEWRRSASGAREVCDFDRRDVVEDYIAMAKKILMNT